MSTAKLKFTDDEIRKLFGHEAAEDESVERLKEYYFKNSAYEQLRTSSDMRIVVGHKGIGKSALLRVIRHEDELEGNLPIEIRPDDLVEVTRHTEFVSMIKEWKIGLRSLVVQHAMRKAKFESEDEMAKVGKSALAITDILRSIFQKKLEQYADGDAINKEIVERFLKNRIVTVYLDDLDRGWQGSKYDLLRLSALLNAARDISRDNPGIRFRIALRTDVYYLIRTADESADKIESSVVWMSWTNHQILALLVKRVNTYFGKIANEKELLRRSQQELELDLDPVFERRLNMRGKWSDVSTRRVLMTMIRRRPRDLVKLLTMAGREARENGSSKIGTPEISSVLTRYSQERLQDTVNEYRSELPEVERLLLSMKPSKIEKSTRETRLYKTDELLKKLNSIIEQGDFMDSMGRKLGAKQLANFLYKINFIIATKEMPSGFRDRKYFEENRYLSSELVDFGYSWEVHPAYRWALEPDSIDKILDELAASDDGSIVLRSTKVSIDKLRG